jgi:hypothetical protein
VGDVRTWRVLRGRGRGGGAVDALERWQRGRDEALPDEFGSRPLVERKVVVGVFEERGVVKLV